MNTNVEDILYCIVIGIMMQGLVIYYCEKNAALARWRVLLHVSAFVWVAMVFVKRYYLEILLPPKDAVRHERYARAIAEMLIYGDYELLQPYLGIGNRAYRLGLGAFYAVTNAPPLVIYAIHSFLAFWGLLSVVDLFNKHFKASQIPFCVIFFSVFSPSALFWTISGLKEGAAIWGICMLMRFSLLYLPNRKKESLVLPMIGTLVIGLLRPQAAVLCMAGLAGGTLNRRMKMSMVLISLAGVVGAFCLIQVLVPGILERILQNGLIETAEAEYSLRAGLGNSAINFHGGKPTPFLSGALLLFTAPWPNEVNNMASLIAGVETWIILIVILYQWKRCPDLKLVLSHPLMMAVLVTLLGYSFSFSYMYNMGLMVRQRLMPYPAILALIAVPAMARVVKADWESRQRAQLKAKDSERVSTAHQESRIANRRRSDARSVTIANRN